MLLSNLCESELKLTNDRQDLKVALQKGLQEIKGIGYDKTLGPIRNENLIQCIVMS